MVETHGKPPATSGISTGQVQLVLPGCSPIGETNDVLQIPLSDACWLRPLDETDADELHALIDANRAYLSRWLTWTISSEP
jgi:hypothetical protein